MAKIKKALVVKCKNCKRIALGLNSEEMRDTIKEAQQIFGVKYRRKDFICCHNMQLIRCRKKDAIPVSIVLALP